ncbi:unnamed protein product [Dicrocoelium dendriticum]|nr:unnamed protein product [Dicrocoelium dendriticum]
MNITFMSDADVGNATKVSHLITGGRNQRTYVRRNVTGTLAAISKRRAKKRYPLTFTFDCPPANQKARSYVYWQDWKKPINCPSILWPDSQVTLELYTKSVLDVINKYTTRKLIPRSLYGFPEDPACPSFLNPQRDSAKCCLFKYSLDVMQMRENRGLDFIVYPKYLPLNMCHGRCVDVAGLTGDYHNVLLNDFYRSLSATDKQKIDGYMPCCSANATASFTFYVAVDKDNLEKTVWPRAIKTSCACY